MLRGLLVLILAMAVASGARGQIAVSAFTDRTVLSEGEVLTFSLDVTGSDDVGQITPPTPTPNLRLQSSAPSFRRRTTFGTQTRLTLGWRYQAVASGPAELSAMRLTVGGQRFSTDPISIDITRGAPPQPRQRPLARPQTVPPGSAGTLFVRAQPRKRSAVVGEQVVVDYILYFDPSVVAPRQAIAVGTWDAPGFWREEMDVPTRDTYPRSVSVGGRNLQAVTIRRLALFPARAGTLELAPMDFDIEVRETDNSDPFAPFFSPFRSRRVDRSATAPSVEINVGSLPDGAPATFNGAVGTFEMSAQVAPEVASPGDPVAFTLTLRGTGNAATMVAPEIETASGVDAYTPQSERTTDTARSPLVSTRTFTYTLVPQSGSFEIPEVAWTYFDPETRSYKTLRRGPFLVSVDGTPLASASPRANPPVAAWQRTRGLSTAPLWGLLGVGLVLPAVAGLGLLGARRRRQRPRKKAAPDARTRLKAAEERPPKEQAAEAERILRDTLTTHLGPLAQTLPRRELVAQVEASKGAETAGDIGDVLERCEAARYAGASGESTLANDAWKALAPFRSRRSRR